MSARLKALLRNYFFDGLLLILLGLAMLIWPLQALAVLCIVVGATLIVMGVIRGSAFFFTQGEDRTAANLLIGLAEIAAGVLLIVFRGFFIGMFQIITGVILLYGAALMLMQAGQLRAQKGPLFVWSLIFAAVTTLLAVLILTDPVAFAAFRTQLHGVSLMVEGLAMMIALRRVKLVAAALPPTDETDD